MMTAALQRHFWVACVLALVAPSSTKALEQEILSPDMAQAMQVAQSHCDALLKEGGAADFRILLGRQAHRLSAQEIQVFEEAFTRKLWRDAGSLPAAGSCRLERHDVGGVDENGLPLVTDGMVISAVPPREAGNAPVSLSYRLVRGDAWRIEEISLDGKPLSQRYRGRFAEILAKRGFEELIAELEKK